MLEGGIKLQQTNDIGSWQSPGHGMYGEFNQGACLVSQEDLND